MTLLLAAIALAQVALGVRVVSRFVRGGGGESIQRAVEPSAERIVVILPVLDEAARIRPCLETLLTQPVEVAEILVVDGGSTDGTQGVVAEFAARDPRVRLVDASPVPVDWAGKAWGLDVGLRHADPASPWILCVDADVTVSPDLARSLLAHARRTGVVAFSLATRQHLSGGLDALIHPALLASLIYRYGIPGHASRNPDRVTANGQCFLARRDVLVRTEAFAAARASICEDITIVRRLAECGEAVGFFEGEDLATTRMYGGGLETLRNWPRSLVMRDQYFGRAQWIGLLEVLFVQALPLPVVALAWWSAVPAWVALPGTALLVIRLGVLAGTGTAYTTRPWPYWLSPLLDLLVAERLFRSALRRQHSWRGRSYARGKGGTWVPTGEETGLL